MMCHYPDLGGASDWSSRVGNSLQAIKGTTDIWVLKRHQHRISTFIPQT